MKTELLNAYIHIPIVRGKALFFGGKNGHELDKEVKLEYVTAYYSTDKNKCKEFLLKKMKEQNELADKIRERMKESKIEIKLLE